MPLFRLLLLLFSLTPSAVLALPANKPTPGYTRVAVETSVGTMVIAVDLKRAPRTSANFLTYVDDGRFDGVTFYRAARRKSNPKLGLIQGGIDTDLRRSLPPIRHEPTSQTGLRHLDATVSMARPNRPNSAAGNFFITVGATPNMDARGTYIGYAAFGNGCGEENPRGAHLLRFGANARADDRQADQDFARSSPRWQADPFARTQALAAGAETDSKIDRFTQSAPDHAAICDQMLVARAW